jgi:phosphatidylethanolamine-binding protein (PEBP) family uncharacterized protein
MRSFVLIMEGPDAPNGTFTPWVLFDEEGEQRQTPAEQFYPLAA